MGTTQKQIPSEWALLYKEVRESIESGETLEDFVERMQDHGFNVTYKKRDLAHERTVVGDVIRFFNITCGTDYKDKYPSAIGNLIIARYRENYTVDAMKQVIKMLCKLWKGTPMHINLRPDIIFGPLKFSGYAGLLAPANRRPAPTPPIKQVTTATQIVETPPRPKILSPQESAQRDTEAMSTWIETISHLDQRTTNILMYLYPINLVWTWITEIKKSIDQPILSKANQFAEQKIEEYKAIEQIDIEQSRETCRRYYIIKSLFGGHTLTELKNWPKPDHFIKYYS